MASHACIYYLVITAYFVLLSPGPTGWQASAHSRHSQFNSLSQQHSNKHWLPFARQSHEVFSALQDLLLLFESRMHTLICARLGCSNKRAPPCTPQPRCRVMLQMRSHC